MARTAAARAWQTRAAPAAAPAPVTVRPMVAADRAAWDALVAADPAGSFCHRAGWAEVLRRGAGLDTHFLVAEADGALAGILPLAESRSRLFGHALVSTAFLTAGGPLATSKAARDALIAAAAALGAERGADHVELRGGVPAETPGWVARDDLHVTFTLPLPDDPEALLRALPGPKRRSIRKGRSLGLVAETDGDLARFYPVFCESVRNLGTPVLPRRWFQAILDGFGDGVEVLTVSQQGRPLSAALLFHGPHDTHCYYVGNTDAARAAAASDFLWFAAMARGIARRMPVFDMGRSKRGTGSFEFKRRWGLEPTPLRYAFRLRDGDRPPEINPLNPKYRLMVEAWKRLPLPVANRVGPLIARSLV